MIIIYKSSEAEKLKRYIGDDLFERQASRMHVCVPLDSQAYFLAFSWYDVREPHKRRERCCIYCGQQEFVFVGDNTLCRRVLAELPQNAPAFDVLASFFYEITADDIDVLERLENTVNELEEELLMTEKPLKTVGTRIIAMRRSLLSLKRYYEQMGLVIDRLTENDNEAIPANLMNRYQALSRHIHYLIHSVLDLREYITQVREAYQAKVDIEQNQIMKVLTVMTSIFLPLTLVVGWYGMNFQMPELGWKFGYPYVTALSVLVCAVCFFIFKKKKWF